MEKFQKFVGENVTMTYAGKKLEVKLVSITGDQFKSSSGREYNLSAVESIHLKNPYCIGKRHNPQISKPYYRMFGRLTRQEILKKESCLYGGMSVTTYDSELEYNTRIEQLKNEGFNVY